MIARFATSLLVTLAGAPLVAQEDPLPRQLGVLSVNVAINNLSATVRGLVVHCELSSSMVQTTEAMIGFESGRVAYGTGVLLPKSVKTDATRAHRAYVTFKHLDEIGPAMSENIDIGIYEDEDGGGDLWTKGVCKMHFVVEGTRVDWYAVSDPSGAYAAPVTDCAKTPLPVAKSAGCANIAEHAPDKAEFTFKRTGF